jgi:CheY-like chemotaxis protein/glycine cleavage system H lipoate-binding protein
MGIQRKVLVVDDEEDICSGLKKLLSRRDLDVDTAPSASDALDKLAKSRYDVVITDMMMPRITGMQLLEKIKASSPEIAVIMITGYATVRTAVQAIKLGAFDYIPKPFTTHEIVSVTMRALERVRIHHEEGPVAPAAEKKPPVAEAAEGELYCIPEHSWLRIAAGGTAVVGMEDMFRRTCGEIVSIDLPFDGDEVLQGKACARVISHGGHVHKLWSPVTGTVQKVNEAVDEDASLVQSDPRGKGWLLEVQPAGLKEDLQNLRHIGPSDR